MDLGMIKQAMEMKKQMDKVQKELAKLTVEAETGKGAVKVVASGQLRIMSIKIDPTVIDPHKSGDLEKMIHKAINSALEDAQKMASKELSKVTSGLNIPGLT
ncbi:MAG: YbaB/EbfC family nucleoid-associated protein [Dehalococcoidia bacterium]|nr:YbaB/EbfC family nucleoid-associated protein [Dehalococcoidia bacterium]